MNEKLVAGIVATAGIAPLCAVCVLGPAAIGSILTGAFAWLGGAGSLLTVALMVAAGLLVYRTLRPKHKPDGIPSEDRRAPHSPTIENNRLRAPGITSGIRSPTQGEKS